MNLELRLREIETRIELRFAAVSHDDELVAGHDGIRIEPTSDPPSRKDAVRTIPPPDREKSVDGLLDYNGKVKA